MGFEQFSKGVSAEQIMQERQREADERAKERLEEEDGLVSIVRPLLAEEIDDDDLIQRRRHRVSRK
jgi:hypothetical protein